MATKDQVLALADRFPELTNNEIARRLDCNPSYVRATIARANGYKPPKRPAAKLKISAAEQAEREQDHRDLDMLSDIAEGHSVRSTAKFYDVPYSRLHSLVVARRRA